MAAILAQRVLRKRVNLHMHACVYLCVRAQMHPYTISKHCLITGSLLHENLSAKSPHTFWRVLEVSWGTKKPKLATHTSSNHKQNKDANSRNQLKHKIQPGVLDSLGHIGLICADKQRGLMV